MIHLIYVCSAAHEPSQRDLVDLLNQARAKNAAMNITGMLLYSKSTYIQVLEGEEAEVHTVFRSIKRDPRVGRLISLVDEEIASRSFPSWSMGFKRIGNSESRKLEGFSEIFNGGVDPLLAARKQDLAVELLMSFAEDPESLRPRVLA